MPVTVFPENELGFVACLARWISPPAKAAKAESADGEKAEPVVPSAFEAECVKMDESGKVEELSAKLRKELLAKVAGGSASDVQNAYAILFELLVTWQLLLKQAESLADELSGSSPGQLPEAEQQLRSSLLLSLYVLVQQHGALEQRFALLLRMISFCQATGALGPVLGPVDARVERVERWVSEWELSEAQQKELWGVVFDAHAADSRVSHECAQKYFALHEAKDLATQPALHKRIVQGLLITIRSPELVRAGCPRVASAARSVRFPARAAAPN